MEHGGRTRDLRGRGLVRPRDVHGEGCDVVLHEEGFDVLGYREEDRAGAFGLRQLEGFAHHLGHGPCGEDHVGPFGDRIEHRHQVDALMRFLVDAVQPDLRRDGHKGSAVAVGICGAEEKVYRSRAEGGRADTGATGQASMDLGHERCSLFVADQDVADGRPRHGIGEPDIFLTRQTEDARDTFVLEAADQQIGDSPLLFGHVGSVANEKALPGPGTRSGMLRRLPTPHDGGPCHAGAEADEEHCVAGVQAPLSDRIDEGQRYGR